MHVTTPRRSRPAMFPRWLIRTTMTPEMSPSRPYLKQPAMRSRMLWVRQMQRQRRAQ